MITHFQNEKSEIIATKDLSAPPQIGSCFALNDGRKKNLQVYIITSVIYVVNVPTDFYMVVIKWQAEAPYLKVL